MIDLASCRVATHCPSVNSVVPVKHSKAVHRNKVYACV